MSRTALVTGATGLVGSYIAERLVADGWHVRTLVRDATRAAWLADLGCEPVPGDVLDATRFGTAARGADAIFHAAAMVTGRGAWEEFRRANIDGTAHAIRAAEESGARLIQVSSVAVYGYAARYRSEPTGEDTPLSPLSPGNHYGRSKRESEALVLEAHRQGRIRGTAVRPDVVYGRRDRQFVPRFARLLRTGVMPLFGGGRNTLAIVHAANVADGAVRAAVSEVAGGRAYNLANDHDVTVADFVRLAGQGLGRRIRFVRIPLPLASAGIGALAAFLRVTRGASFASQARASVAFLTRDNPFTSERARRELGWSPTVHPEEGIPEAFRWWRMHGSGA